MADELVKEPEAATAPVAAQPAAPPTNLPKRTTDRTGPLGRAIKTNARARGLAQNPPGIRSKLQGAANSLTSALSAQKFRRALSSAKGRWKQSSLKGAIAAAGEGLRGVRKGHKRRAGTVGQILIAGEKVRLDEEGFNPARHADVVSFSQKYFPGRPLTEIDEERDVFRKVFGDAGETMNIDNPLPPCIYEERQILLAGLKNRFETLRQEFLTLMAEKGDTADTRQRVAHLQRLKIFINELEKRGAEGVCKDYTQEGAKGFGTTDTETEDEIRALLRQFAFLVLQAKSPVAEYNDMTEEAKKFVDVLRNKRLSKEEMNAYFALWREQNAALEQPEKFPYILAEVLESTDTQRGLLDTMLDDKIEELYREIREIAEKNYQEIPALLDAFVNKIKEIEAGGLTPKEKIMELIQFILEINRKAWEELDTAQREEERLKELLEDMDVRMRDLNKNLATATQDLVEARETIKKQIQMIRELEADSVKQEALLESSMKAFSEKEGILLEQINTLTTSISSANKAKGAVEADLKTCETRNEELGKDAAAALATQESLQAVLEQKDVEIGDQKGRIQQLEESLQQKTEELGRLTVDLTAAKGVAEAKTKEAANVASQIAGLRGEIATLQGNASGDKKTLAERDAAVAAATALAASYETALRAKEEEALKAQEAVARLEAEKKEAEAAATVAAATLAETRDAVVAAKEEAGNSAAAAATEIAGLKEKLQARDAELARMQNELATASDAMAKHTETMNGLYEQIKGLNAGKLECEKNLALAQAAVESGQADMEDEKKRLEGEKAAVEAKLAEKQGELDAVKADFDKKLGDARANYAELEKRLSIAERAKGTAAIEITELRGRLATLTQNLADARAAAEGGVAELNRTAESEKGKLIEEINQWKAKYAEAEKEVAKIKDIREDCLNKNNELAKAVAEEKEATAAARKELADLIANIVNNAKTMATNMLSGQYDAPAGIDKRIGTAFAELLSQARGAAAKAREDGKAEGAAENPEKKFSAATQTCFLSYFITFFMKALFFSREDRERRKEAYTMLKEKVDALLVAYKEKINPQEKDEKILYRMLATLFGLLYASETLILNRQDHGGNVNPQAFVGLNIIKQNGPDGGPDKERAAIVKIIHEEFLKGGGIQGLLKQITGSIFSNLLLQLPWVHFIPPYEVGTVGDISEVSKLLYEYPGFFYFGKEEDRTSPDIRQRFQEINVNDGFTTKPHSLTSISSNPIAMKTWGHAFLASRSDKALPYATVFGLFIVLGQEYLKRIQETLKEFHCALPAALNNPESMEATLEQENSMEGSASAPMPLLRSPRLAEMAQSSPPITDLDRPIMAGGTSPSNPATFHMILSQLKQGEGASFKAVIKNDLKQYADTVEFPIKNFIAKYKTIGSTVFKGLPEITIQKGGVLTVPTKMLTSMINYFEGTGGYTNPQKRGTTCKVIDGKSKCYGGNLNYIKLFLLDFFRAYIQQYKIEGASTIDDKINGVYPEFEAYLGTVVKGSSTQVSLFEKLGLTKEVFAQYCKEADDIIPTQRFPEYNVKFQTFVEALSEPNLQKFINVV